MATAPPFRSIVLKDERTQGGTIGDLCSHRADRRATAQLSLLVMQEIGSLVNAAQKPPVAGLLDSVVMVVMLMRRNGTQAAAAAHFHCSQPTIPRRWDLLRPVIGRVLRPICPRSRPGARPRGNCPVNGTVCPVSD